MALQVKGDSERQALEIRLLVEGVFLRYGVDFRESLKSLPMETCYEALGFRERLYRRIR